MVCYRGKWRTRACPFERASRALQNIRRNVHEKRKTETVDFRRYGGCTLPFPGRMRERCADSVANGRLRDRRNEGSGFGGWNNGELRGIRFFGTGVEFPEFYEKEGDVISFQTEVIVPKRSGKTDCENCLLPFRSLTQ